MTRAPARRAAPGALIHCLADSGWLSGDPLPDLEHTDERLRAHAVAPSAATPRAGTAPSARARRSAGTQSRVGERVRAVVLRGAGRAARWAPGSLPQRWHQHPGDLERCRLDRDREGVVAVRVEAEQRDALVQ
jgi:hypothetical protein